VVNEKTEKVIVDKELTNSVMQKFEDADKRRQQATSEEIQVHSRR
jgi:cation transport regulator ChaB